MTLSRQAMQLAILGGLGSDELTINLRRLVLELERRGVTEGVVAKDGLVTVATVIRGEHVTIVVGEEGFELPKSIGASGGGEPTTTDEQVGE